MKKLNRYLTLSLPIAIGAAAALLIPVGDAATFSAGPPAGRSGAPSESTCALQCHTSFDLNSGPGSMTIVGPDSIIPGQANSLSVEFADTERSKHGFELTLRDASDTFVGEFILTDPDSTKLTGDGDAWVTHNQAGNRKAAWMMDWIAPSDLADSVKVYVAGVAANDGDGNKEDYVYTASLAIDVAEAQSTSNELPLAIGSLSTYPNPFQSQLTVEYDLASAANVEVELVDMTGRTIRALPVGTQSAGPQTATLNEAGLATGTYVLRVSADTEVHSRLVVKQ